MQGDPVTPPNVAQSAAKSLTSPKSHKQDVSRRPSRKPGRPATYVFDKPDDQLSEKERKMKISIEKRRLRQNRSYHRRKKLSTKNTSTAAVSTATAAVAAAATSSDAPSVAVVPSASANSSSDAASNPSSFLPISGPSSSDPVLSHSMLHPTSSVLLHPVSAVNVATVPKLIPGFSQNPLELLASATADRNVPNPLTHASVDSPMHPIDSTKLPIDSECDLTSGVVQIATSVGPAEPITESSVPMAVVPSVDDELEFDATAAPMGESSFSFGLESNKRSDENEEEEEDTDLLVNNALLAAKEYARDSMNLKNVMDRESDLHRMTGIKTIVFDNLRTKYITMPSDMQSALRHFVIFPRTFNLNAAAAVAGFADADLVTVQGMLESMVQTNFIVTSRGRYELNDAARLFLNEDPSVMTQNLSMSTYERAQKRFVEHYRGQLAQLQDDDIHKIGFLREKAMALFDSERENMEFSEFLLSGRHDELRKFLSAGITVMRYCVGASNRERALKKALLESEEDVSTDNALLVQANQSVVEASHSSEKDITNLDNDKSHRARLFLALSESYFDQLKLSEAEQPLLEALKLMRDVTPRGGATTSSNIVDSVLVLLLLSNLRMSSNRVKEARVLCVKALRILAEAGLGRSTFGINAMSNLVSIYLMEGHLDKAKSVASRLLDTLNTMSYTGMPIYADALGVCATVSMAERNFKEAEKQFSRALETVGKWGSKEWTGIPVQHCLDLDLWLMEGLADAIRGQGKVVEAMVLVQRAAQDRESRGLSSAVVMQAPGSSSDDSGAGRPSLRHLY